jgi:ABC-type enterobactin transport system permease subunit
MYEAEVRIKIAQLVLCLICMQIKIASFEVRTIDITLGTGQAVTSLVGRVKKSQVPSDIDKELED